MEPACFSPVLKIMGNFWKQKRPGTWISKLPTGQRGEEPNSGSEIVVVSLRSRMVLDHLTMTVHTCWLKTTSPLVKCLVKSN